MLSSPAMEQDLEQCGPDPVLSDFEFPIRKTLYPLGFGLELATNSPEVIDAAMESWGSYQQTSGNAPVRLELGVAPGDSAIPIRSTFRSRGHLMSMIANRENFVMSDFNAGSAL